MDQVFLKNVDAKNPFKNMSKINSTIQKSNYTLRPN